MEWKVSAEDAGNKLITFLVQRIGSQYSARAIKKAIEKNQCIVNNHTERFASSILAKGDRVVLSLSSLDHIPSSEQMEKKRVLYEDEDLLIYNKPAGLTSDLQGILTCLHPYYPQLKLIHRLDRDTSGILLCAKNAFTLEHMIQQFRELRVKKSYIALVDGVPAHKQGTIKNHLGKKHTYSGQAIWGSVKAEAGSYAETEWRVIKKGQEASVVECHPKTGRTHQLRVHLSDLGHPILGDFQYGKHFICPYRPMRHLLHANKIAFNHPRTGLLLKIQAQLPDDILTAQQVLGLV